MPQSTRVDLLADLADHLARYDTDALGRILSDSGVVQLPDFLPSAAHQALDQQVDALLDSCGKRIDVRVRSTGNTPRKYISVGRNDVFEHASLIKQLYFDSAFIRFFSRLMRHELIAAPYEPEQVVVNRMDQEGDTHGWHWDDYSYSVVLVLTAPLRMNGAQLECVDGTVWDKDAARVEHYLRTMPVRSVDLTAGSAYVLQGKRVMHRVSPMLRADVRKIICFTYATEAEQTLSIDHGSMQDIYG
jgi:hypothetical protein